MKFFRVVVIVTFIIGTFAFVAFNWSKNTRAIDSTFPEILFDEEILKVSVKDEKDVLLRDVVAKDEKDGDLTNGIIVESISKFIDKEKHICNVTYVVEDRNKNITKRTRKVMFTDYRPPRFTLSQQLCLEVGSDIGPEEIIGAVDDFDGDISNKVKVLSRTVSTNASGDYVAVAQVTNSLGDTAKIKAPVVIKQSNYLSPTIDLTDNIIYLKKGEEFNPHKYIREVTDKKGRVISKSEVEIVKSSVNVNKKGCYTVQYAVEGMETQEGDGAYLTVVVED